MGFFIEVLLARVLRFQRSDRDIAHGHDCCPQVDTTSVPWPKGRSRISRLISACKTRFSAPTLHQHLSRVICHAPAASSKRTIIMVGMEVNSEMVPDLEPELEVWRGKSQESRQHGVGLSGDFQQTHGAGTQQRQSRLWYRKSPLGKCVKGAGFQSLFEAVKAGFYPRLRKNPYQRRRRRGNSNRRCPPAIPPRRHRAQPRHFAYLLPD